LIVEEEGMRPLRGFRPAFLATLAALAASGCFQPASGTVMGGVSVDGKPLRAGAIRFHGAGGQVVTAAVNHGAFHAAGVPPGMNRVTVVSVPIVEGLVWTRPGDPISGDASSGEVSQPVFIEQPIPRKFATQEDTPLEYAIVAGQQQIDIELSAPRK
jgi:hypothetical protein